MEQAPARSTEQLRSRLFSEGFAWISAPLTESEFVAVAREMGEIVDDTPVRVVPGKRTYLARPDPIPFHTDHPKADVVAWRCESQDAADGASLLVDGYRVLRQLQAQESKLLKTLRLPAMVRLGDEATPTPIVSGDPLRPLLFYAPWLEPIDRLPETQGSLVALRRALSREEERARSFRLRPGEVLLVDNHRMLHGRGRLLPESTRRLRRFWLKVAGGLG